MSPAEVVAKYLRERGLNATVRPGNPDDGRSIIYVKQHGVRRAIHILPNLKVVCCINFSVDLHHPDSLEKIYKSANHCVPGSDCETCEAFQETKKLMHLLRTVTFK